MAVARADDPTLDEVDDKYEQKVEEAKQALLDEIRERTKPGTNANAPGIAQALTQIATELQISLATVREALTYLVYSGDLFVTEDRRLTTDA